MLHEPVARVFFSVRYFQSWVTTVALLVVIVLLPVAVNADVVSIQDRSAKTDDSGPVLNSPMTRAQLVNWLQYQALESEPAKADQGDFDNLTMVNFSMPADFRDGNDQLNLKPVPEPSLMFIPICLLFIWTLTRRRRGTLSISA